MRQPLGFLPLRIPLQALRTSEEYLEPTRISPGGVGGGSGSSPPQTSDCPGKKTKVFPHRLSLAAGTRWRTRYHKGLRGIPSRRPPQAGWGPLAFPGLPAASSGIPLESSRPNAIKRGRRRQDPLV